MTDNKQSRWDPVKDLMAGAAPVQLGPMHSYHMANTPRRLLYTFSYYKFAAKMIGQQDGDGPKRVLDIGCGEGIGTWTLAKECGFAKGVDFDEDLIAVAKGNWVEPDESNGIEFSCEDALAMDDEPFDAVVNFDVIEHILPEHETDFLQGMANKLKQFGLAIMGTPNITSQPYASAVTNAGHVNLFSGERLEATMQKYFTQVFMFGANDEVVHTGFLPMAHYLIAVGVKPRRD